MQWTFRVIAVAICCLLAATASVGAQTIDTQKQAVDLITQTADKICSSIGTSGQTTSSQFQGDVKAQLTGLAAKLADLGLSGSGAIKTEQYQGVLQSDLANSLRDNAQCKLAVFNSMYSALIRPPAICRDPTNGVERYTREFDVTKDSGWRGGGYDPSRWCQDLLAMVRSDNPKGDFSIVNKQEQRKNTCSPFNCPQYLYICTVHVKTDPIYKEAASPACAPSH